MGEHLSEPRDAPPRTREVALSGDEDRGRGWWQGARAKLRRRREEIRGNTALNTGYRIALGVLGGAALAAGIVLIPYPGPGWLIVFAGLGILATEFHWARRVNTFAKRHYDAWLAWMRRQHPAVRLAVAAATGALVLVTLWLLDLFGTAAEWFDLRWPWLRSPLFGP